MLGKKMKSIAVTMISKSKPEEPAKPKVEQHRVEVPNPIVPANQPKVQQNVQISSPPSTISAAPAPVNLPLVSFSDGAKEVLTSNDPIQLYKAYIEFLIKGKWEIPANKSFETMVDININERGEILKTEVASDNGDVEWTRSIKNAISNVKLSRLPPKGFPLKFKIRFDMVSEN